MVLNPSEYDASYFDGDSQSLKHNAGYARYERWKRFDGVDSLGEFWKDKAKGLFDEYSMRGKKILEIGCAKGFVVEDLRSFGADAYGLDVSSYAIGKAIEAVKPFLTVGDVRTHLKNYKDNEFDMVFSLRFLECIDEADLPALIIEINRISKFQFHELDEGGNTNFYIIRPLSWWKEFSWKTGTTLVSNTNKSVLVK